MGNKPSKVVAKNMAKKGGGCSVSPGRKVSKGNMTKKAKALGSESKTYG